MQGNPCKEVMIPVFLELRKYETLFATKDK
jgi:hypothetical protein